ncbi:MAG: hypothetical protein WC627_02260 [Legionella sp.]|jgi:hypothetical protein
MRDYIFTDHRTIVEVQLNLAKLATDINDICFKGSLSRFPVAQVAGLLPSISLNVQAIDFTGCSLGMFSANDLVLLFSLIPKTVTVLNLSNNFMSRFSNNELATIIKAIPKSVKILNLGDNFTLLSADENSKVLNNVLPQIKSLSLGSWLNEHSMVHHLPIILLSSFKNLVKSVTEINLSGCKLNSLPVVEVIRILRAIPKQVDSLDLSCIRFLYHADTECFSKILQAIPDNITSLDLGCPLDSRREYLSEFNVGNGNKFAKALSFLPKSIKILKLSQLHADFEDFMLIIKSIPKNVTHLELRENFLNFSNEQWIAILKAMPNGLIYLDLKDSLTKNMHATLQILKHIPKTLKVLDLGKMRQIKEGGEEELSNIVQVLPESITVLRIHEDTLASLSNQNLEKFLEKISGHLSRLVLEPSDYGNLEKNLTADQIRLVETHHSESFMIAYENNTQSQYSSQQYTLWRENTNVLLADKLIAVLNALSLEVTSFDLCGLNLFDFAPADIIRIFQAIPKSITTLNLNDNNLGSLGTQKTEHEFDIIIQTVKKLPSHIKSLNLSCNQFNSLAADQFQALLEALPVTITSVDLSDNQLFNRWNVVFALSQPLPKNLGSIGLNWEDFRFLNQVQISNLLNTVDCLKLTPCYASDISRLDTTEAVSVLKQIGEHIRTLDLSENYMDDKHLTIILKHCPEGIIALNLSKNNLYSHRSTLEQFFHAIPDSIRTLDLSDNGFFRVPIENSIKALKAIHKNVTFLNLSSNGLENHSVTDFAKLAQNIPEGVELLNLSSNGLSSLSEADLLLRLINLPSQVKTVIIDSQIIDLANLKIKAMQPLQVTSNHTQTPPFSSLFNRGKVSPTHVDEVNAHWSCSIQ